MAKDLKSHHRLQTEVEEDDVLIATEAGSIFKISQKQIEEYGELPSEKVADEIKKKVGNFSAGLEYVKSPDIEGKSYIFNCPAFEKPIKSRIPRMWPVIRPPLGPYAAPRYPIVIVRQAGDVYILGKTVFDNEELQWKPSKKIDKWIKRITAWMVLEGVASAFFRPSKKRPFEVCTCYLINCESFKDPDNHE